MSLATRCPACGTTFSVVRDQLRISDGWVRCGRCSVVFDASEHLQDLSVAAGSPPVRRSTEADATATAPAPAPAPARGDVLPVPESALPAVAAPAQPIGPAATSSPLEGLTEGIEAMAANAAAPRPGAAAPRQEELTSDSTLHDDPPWAGRAADNGWQPSLPSLEMGKSPKRAAVWSTFRKRGSAAESQPTAAPLLRTSATEAEPLPTPSPSLPLTSEDDTPVLLPRASQSSEPAAGELPPPVVQATADASPSPDAAPPVSFLNGPAGETDRKTSRRRAALLAVAAIALIVLVLQVVMQFRDLLVARHPALQPAFASLCEVARCQLSALRQIDDITIEGSSFTRQRTEGGYLLNFTLRNRATVPLAMPSVEIALLDLQERAVVRRVLRPAEFGAPALLAARGERSASLPLELKLPAAEAAAFPAIAGYHLNAFYP